MQRSRAENVLGRKGIDDQGVCTYTHFLCVEVTMHNECWPHATTSVNVFLHKNPMGLMHEYEFQINSQANF